MKTQADKYRKERNFEIADLVFLKLKQHRQHSVAARISLKLSTRYYGPLEVIERIEEVAYKLKLPTSSKIHPIFHVSLLKKAHGDYKVEITLPSGLEDDREGEIEPELVLATRSIMQRGEKVNQWLVQWKGKSVEEAT